jgi:hypothetical protein
MQVWQGWTPYGEASAIRAPKWDEWVRKSQGVQHAGNHRQERLAEEQEAPFEAQFTERELARLSFVRWLYLTGRLNPLDPCERDLV